jgi:hypothetical protein
MLMLPWGRKRHARARGNWWWWKGLTLSVMCIVPGFCVLADQPEVDESIDAIIFNEGQVFCVRAGQPEAATNTVKLPFQVEVTTNGTFTVAGGPERELKQGQSIRRDGWLVDPSGALEPVFDHVRMVEGAVMVVRDGNAGEIGEPMLFSNGLSIAPDGSVIYPSGNRSRLVDGQLFRTDGTSLASKDTATMINGQVVMLKSGTLITLSPAPMWGMMKIMGMNDGTTVRSDGLITRPDGSAFRLTDGQTILIDGPAARS